MILYLSSAKHTNLLDFISFESADHGMTVKRLVGHFELKQFVVHDMRNFSHFTDVVLDRPAFAETDRELIEAIQEFLTMYDIRLTVICEGVSQSEPLFQALLGIGVRNLVHGTDILEIQQEIRECLGKDGMLRYVPEKALTGKCREHYHFTCKNSVIAVAGSQARIGVTTVAVGFCAWLASVGAGVCYVESNHSGHLKDLVRSYGMEQEHNGWLYEGVHYTSWGMSGEQDFNFLVYDMGNDFSARQQMLTSADLRLLVCGTKPYELAHTMRLQVALADHDAYLLCPFVADEIRDDLVKALQSDCHKVLPFAYQPELTDGSCNAKQYRIMTEKHRVEA